jgi:ergothioneine biosynthesis protein EgtB
MPRSAFSKRVQVTDSREEISAHAAAAAEAPAGDPRSHWLKAFRAVRAETERRAVSLSAEDQVIQSMPDASPAKWHRAHVTWFFEQFLLRPFAPNYRIFDERFGYLFNSYYVSAGPRQARPQRGLITRPGAEEVTAYRAHVDEAVAALIETASDFGKLVPLVVLGLNHEQQHQELLVTDILHAFAQNETHPAYDRRWQWPDSEHAAAGGGAFISGIHSIGHNGGGFCFDNEQPAHQVLLHPVRLARSLVTNGEWLAFMADGGYATPTLWLSDGFAAAEAQGWNAPGYWRKIDGEWFAMTLGGLRRVEPQKPVCHVSYYEADAFARWSGRRLATEAEWEVAAEAAGVDLTGNLMDRGVYHPLPAPAQAGLTQLIGDCWEWTQSPYVGYPGYRPSAGAIGEYNGKFMVNQMVLRGGAAVTPAGHVRLSYRNFFPPASRWAFGGIRLAEDL